MSSFACLSDVLVSGQRSAGGFSKVNNEREFMSPEELRVWLGIGRTKCYEILSRNEIPSYKIGKVLRIKRTDAEEWLEGHRSTSEDL